MKTLGRVRKTSRGFEYMEFEDIDGAPCSLQKSSLADERAVWLGCDESREVLNSTRMHLNRRLVIALRDRLENWLDHGSFK